MGAWGTAIFDNDTAMDWLADLDEADDAGLLDDTLLREEDAGAFLDADTAQCALCAAEIVAALRGAPTPELPADAKRWVACRFQLDVADLQPRALLTIDLVFGTQSELLELWQENRDDYPIWQHHVLDLKRRLTQGAQ